MSSRPDRLTELMQYLNLEEMRDFCRAHGLPMHIHVEAADGRIRKTGDRDRKDIVLGRIAAFALRGARGEPTIYRRAVVSDAPLPATMTGRTRLRYRQYDKYNPRFMETMARLTDGTFRADMIARLVLRDFWTAGQAPTLRAFAQAWLRARANHKRPRPEGAYLVDLWKGTAGPEWKRVRVSKAHEALRMLRALIAKQSA